MGHRDGGLDEVAGAGWRIRGIEKVAGVAGLAVNGRYQGIFGGVGQAPSIIYCMKVLIRLNTEDQGVASGFDGDKGSLGL